MNQNNNIHQNSEVKNYDRDLPSIQPQDTVWKKYLIPERKNFPSMGNKIEIVENSSIEDNELPEEDTVKIEESVIPDLTTKKIVESENPMPEKRDRSCAKSQEPLVHPKKQPVLLPGASLEHYNIESELGKGGMGVVYKAWDIKLHRTVAIKLVLNSINIHEREIARFLQEARLTAQLQHPNIVQIFEVGEKPKPYFVMEYIEGKTLKALNQQGKITLKNVVPLFILCARAIQAAHEKGIIHRDLKPHNIMVMKNFIPKIMDFGLAKQQNTQEGLSKSGDIMGTPAYMSPEQAMGEIVDIRSDIYSLGATLYESLVGRPPYQGETNINILSQVINSKCEPIRPRAMNPNIHPDLEAICLKSLEKNILQRYSSAEEMAEDLQNFLENRPIKAQPVTNLRRFQKLVMRNKAVSFSVVLLFLSLIVGITVSTFLWWKAEESKKSEIIQRQIAQDNEKKAEIEKEKAKSMQIKTEESRKMQEKDAYMAKIQLAKIALAKAQEAHERREWRQSGILCGACLQFVMNLSGDEAEELRRQADDLLLSAFLKYGLIWVKEMNVIGGLVGAKLHKDGRTLMIPNNSFSNSYFRFYDLVSGEYHETVKIKDAMFFEGITQDGEIAYGAGDKNHKVWDVASGKCLHTFETEIKFDEKILANNSIILLCSKNSMEIWDRSAGISKKYLHDISNYTNVAISHDSLFIAFATQDKILVIWDIQKQKSVQKFKINLDDSCLIFSPDGKNIVLGGKDGKILVCNISKHPKLLHNLHYHSAAIVALAFMDNSILVSASESIDARKNKDRTIKIYDLLSGQTLASMENNFRNAFMRKYNTLDLHVNPDTKQIVYSFEEGARDPDTIGAGCGFNMVVVRDISALLSKTPKCVYQGKQHNGCIRSLCFSASRKNILSAGDDRAVKIWNLETGEKKQIGEHADVVSCVVFSNSGKWIASGSYDKTVKLWDAETGKIVWTLQDNLSTVHNLKFSPDDKFLAIGDEVVKVWDTEKKEFHSQLLETRMGLISKSQYVQNYGIAQGTVMSLEWSLDSQKVGYIIKNEMQSAIGYTVQVWDVPLRTYDRQFFQEPVIALSDDLKNVLYQQDGNTSIGKIDWTKEKVIGRNENKEIDMSEESFPKHPKVLQNHLLNCLTFNHAKTLIAGVWKDHIIVFSSISASEMMRFPIENTQNIQALAFSKDDNLLAAGFLDGAVKVWSMEKEKRAYPSEMVFPSWGKTLVNQKECPKSHGSRFDYLVGIPGWFWEYAVKKAPKYMTKFFFGGEVTETLEVLLQNSISDDFWKLPDNKADIASLQEKKADENKEEKSNTSEPEKLSFYVKEIPLKNHKAALVQLAGPINTYTSQVCEKQLLEYFQQGMKDQILVFSEVSYINSIGMGLLVKMTEEFQKKGGSIKIVKVSDKIKSLFNMLGLIPLLKIYATEKEAIETYENP